MCSVFAFHVVHIQEGKTAIVWASGMDNCEGAQILLDSGCEIDLDIADRVSALFFAVHLRVFACVAVICSVPGVRFCVRVADACGVRASTLRLIMLKRPCSGCCRSTARAGSEIAGSNIVRPVATHSLLSLAESSAANAKARWTASRAARLRKQQPRPRKSRSNAWPRSIGGCPPKTTSRLWQRRARALQQPHRTTRRPRLLCTTTVPKAILKTCFRLQWQKRHVRCC